MAARPGARNQNPRSRTRLISRGVPRGTLYTVEPVPAVTTRWLVRFGYYGAAYHGWARQPRLRTVEGQILRAVVRRGIASSAVSAKIEVASRTDRGVSAVGNALALTSSLPPNALLRVLNGVEPDIDFTAARAVPESFRVRAAIRRVYRYFQAEGAHDTRKWSEVARHFSGSVDVRSFGRALPAGSPVWRTIESVTVTSRPGGTVVELRAPSFVWGMARKIVAALREVEAGRVSVDRLDAALQGWTRLTLPMAESEPLVLWNVEYDLPWEYFWAGPNRHQLAWERSSRENLWSHREILDLFTSRTLPERK